MAAPSPRQTQVQILLDQLRSPLKLKVVLCVILLVGWYFLFYSPLSDQIATTQARIARERKRVAAAHQIDGLRKGLASFKERVAARSDPNEFIQYVMTRVRNSSLKLVDLNPEKPRTVGPFDALTLRLRLEGTYAEIDELLTWIQTDRRMLRVDSLSLAPASRLDETKRKGPIRLTMQLNLTSLAERTQGGTTPG